MLFEDNLQDKPYMLKEESEVLEERVQPKRKPKRKSKSFQQDLGLLFNQEEVEEKVQEIKKGISERRKRKRGQGKGLDALIRNTLKGHQEVSATKRITLTMAVQKVERLQEIAKEEKKRLRAIIDDLVDEYLREHGEDE